MMEMLFSTMDFSTFFAVALMPVLMTLSLVGVGVVLALDCVDLLDSSARRYVNNLVFYVFNPCLMAAYLANSITLEVVVEMWFMPVNILIGFLVGSALGWILTKITRAPRDLQGPVIGCCAAGNLRNLPLILIPAICSEPKNPFGDYSTCMADGAAYISVSMAVGGIYTWSYVYVIMKTLADKVIGVENDNHHSAVTITPESAALDNTQPLLISKEDTPLSMLANIKKGASNFVGGLKIINLKMLLAPTTIGSIVGFVIGLVPLLKNLLIGSSAPLRLVYKVSDILGEATVPCVTLILGANLLRGLRRSGVNTVLILGIIVVRFIALPLLGIVVVRSAHHLGLVGPKPFYQFVLMLQFALPPAMQVGTISQLLETGEGDCSVIMLWTYSAATLALTLWFTLFMWLVF